MKHKRFFCLSAAAAVVLLALVICGCGDSVSNRPYGSDYSERTGGTAVDLSNAHYLVLKNDGTAALDGQ